MQKFIDELISLANLPVTVPRNPRVAALIVNETGEIIARGVHKGSGTNHAEIDALNKLSGDLSKCTMYVSLEPCNHFGATPPCTDTIIDSGIKEVIIGSLDPNPNANGGLKKLVASGIQVQVMSDQSVFIELNRRWFDSIRLQRCFVTLKTAISIDGFISKARNERYQITSAEALDYSNKLRSQFDAILVGTNTAEVDNPNLTIRNCENIEVKQPLRVIMGMRNLSPALNIFNSNAQTIQIKSHDPKVILNELYETGIKSLLIEGGSSIHAAFLHAGLVDEINMFMANKFLGDGLNMFDGLRDLPEHLDIQFKSTISLGSDLLIQANVFGS